MVFFFVNNLHLKLSIFSLMATFVTNLKSSLKHPQTFTSFLEDSWYQVKDIIWKGERETLIKYNEVHFGELSLGGWKSSTLCC
jgi:hypothetical protein